ncbi:MAG: hypothetical protein COY22_00740 [Candidatus Tagabacteria bacterium CG_4_10_14_0_2_um_filter_40_13]|uniref:peptidylprolyl isomerase n=2 Tax=Candidatus Tagaibacteriota TaxID=1817918 RepID=A0A2M7B8S7_9BACT|nr:MAG: hypothetical protein COV90_00660 [Candidatus Tagabacteria bacterium CG11_big_fil_rev_8_21_14_0_20_41_11]PIU99514.1 MAG: hypothetical protein COS58_01930 [Candidatus Tagabacteria bacterium CG03_land_8_20_14_0_80_41_22]PIZ56547.1 MAG: hypothetical protein COY22_00740 [Candidatus Tagabacteria bacterium CG_4_10_14_0_2_um_filter_40_13]PJC25027.1 MAG: hypothetical protein CO056_02435 [Candidatus Tagabacteria bacterium CG_4_9_14_0_2_um_filter_41_11]
MDNNPEVAFKKRQFISTKTAIIIAVIIILAALVYYYKGLFIAATINGSPITRLAVIKELEKASGKQALDSLITKKLINNEAIKKGISITSEEVDAEIKTIEDQIKAQGQTLEQALATKNMKLEDLKQQILTRKTLEKILADKLQVTEDEITKFITDNNVAIPQGQEEAYRTQIIAQLKQQKLNTEAETLITSLRSGATIKYFTNY